MLLQIGVSSPRKSLSRAAYRITIKNQSLGTTSLLATSACLSARQLDLRSLPASKASAPSPQAHQIGISSSSSGTALAQYVDDQPQQSQQLVLTPHRLVTTTEFASRLVVKVLVLVLGFVDRDSKHRGHGVSLRPPSCPQASAPAGSIITYPCQAS